MSLTVCPLYVVCAVPTFAYCPATASPVLVSVALAPTANVEIVPIGPTLSSVTAMFVSVTFPVFVTSYVHVTVDPTTTGPVGVSASTPFVLFSSERLGCAGGGQAGPSTW